MAVSPFTARALKALPRFAGSRITIIPNSFTALPVDGASPASPVPRPRVTLVSGVGPNKAFAQALALMAEAAADERLAGLGFDVVGSGPEHARPTALSAAARARGLALPQITVHGLLPRAELDALIAGNAVTWAHSLAEGFGRVVVEGRAAGRPVVMSRLPVFRALSDQFTFSYRNTAPAEFRQALRDALDASGVARPYRLVARLRAEAAAGLRELLTL